MDVEILLAGILIPVAAIIYFLPSLIALKRRHHNRNAIFALNLCLGFTLVGWAVSLSWSLTKIDNNNQSSRGICSL